jgi:hypothetical protein
VSRLQGDTDSLDDEIADFCATNETRAPRFGHAIDYEDNDDDDEANYNDDDGESSAAASAVLVQGLSQDQLDSHNLAMAVDFSRVMGHDERVLFLEDFVRALKDPRTCAHAFELSTSRRSAVRRASIIEENDFFTPLLPSHPLNASVDAASVASSVASTVLSSVRSGARSVLSSRTVRLFVVVGGVCLFWFFLDCACCDCVWVFGFFYIVFFCCVVTQFSSSFAAAAAFAKTCHGRPMMRRRRPSSPRSRSTCTRR